MDEQVRNILEENKAKHYWIGIDVGGMVVYFEQWLWNTNWNFGSWYLGTNTRVTIMLDGTNIKDYITLVKFRNVSTDELKKGIADLGSELKKIMEKPSKASCLAAAGPIIDQREVF